jgi:hypothetical protein
MSYTLTWRKVTPKGVPSKTDFKSGLQDEELVPEIEKLLPTVCWVYLQKDEINFPGNLTAKPKDRQKGPKR